MHTPPSASEASLPPVQATLTRGSLTTSAIVPARNEAACIAAVVHALRAQRRADGEPLLLEVVVADNGSTDDTARIAKAAGARVVPVPERGYGRACWEAARISLGDRLLFVDGDGAADPADAAALLAALDKGAELAIGVRHRPDPGAMTTTQRMGNALACLLMRAIWRMPVHDLGPHRAVSRQAFDRMDLQDRSFGWTVEMQVRAHVLRQPVAHLPVQWHARTGGVSKISGTLQGVLGAGIGILGMIARLWWRELKRRPLADPPRPTYPSSGNEPPRFSRRLGTSRSHLQPRKESS